MLFYATYKYLSYFARTDYFTLSGSELHDSPLLCFPEPASALLHKPFYEHGRTYVQYVSRRRDFLQGGWEELFEKVLCNCFVFIFLIS